jgi:hypothetical protein
VVSAMPSPQDGEDECRHGLTPSTCSICRHPSNMRYHEPLKVVARLNSSHYGGHCPECNLPIYEGSPIAKVTTGAAEYWVHSSCAPE